MCGARLQHILCCSRNVLKMKLSAAVSKDAAACQAARRKVCATRSFVGTNLNRLFANLPPQPPEDGPATGPGPPSELTRAAALARAIQGASAYLDLHSTSADTPPFAFQQPGCACRGPLRGQLPRGLHHR